LLSSAFYKLQTFFLSLFYFPTAFPLRPFGFFFNWTRLSLLL
jgi:hypothetical protein